MAEPLVALVTAGSAGLGASTARLFAQNGMRVVVNYSSNTERAEALVAELRQISPLATTEDGTNFHAVKADLSSRDEIRRLVKETIDVLGKLDVVFSNGGWTHIRNIKDLDDNVNEDDWDMCFNMNVKSHLWLMHAAKPYLDESEGAFITTASLAGVKVSGSSLAYSVTKAAQIHLAKGLALIGAPKIRVNTVSPGLLLTVCLVEAPFNNILKAHHEHTGMGPQVSSCDTGSSKRTHSSQTSSYCRGNNSLYHETT